MLEYMRYLRRATADAIIMIDNVDRGEYRFDFCDDSVMIVHQGTARAVATTLTELENIE